MMALVRRGARRWLAGGLIALSLAPDCSAADKPGTIRTAPAKIN
ncbi:MAG: hypothetical protein ACYC2R_04830 [Burkholderiales bacterium]